MRVERYLTVRGVARILRCTDARVKQLAKAGRIPGAIDIGTAAKSVWRIPLAGLGRIDRVAEHAIQDNEFGL